MHFSSAVAQRLVELGVSEQLAPVLAVLVVVMTLASVLTVVVVWIEGLWSEQPADEEDDDATR